MRLLLLLALSLPLLAQPRHVILLSIDGFPAFSLHDPTLPIPTIRRLAREGAVAQGMTVVNPSVTWPNHTTLVTGVTPARHGVLYNGLPVRGKPGEPLKIEPWVDKSLLVRSPTLYDRAHAAGLTTAEVDWVAVHKPKTITWAFPEVPDPAGVIEREMIAAGLVTADTLRAFSKQPITLRDEIWTQAAIHILTRHKPNLLLFHLLATDSAQHRYAPGSLAAHSALALADSKVARLLDALAAHKLLDRATLVIVSDHGFKSYRKLIHANALLKARGLAGNAQVISEGGTAMVYATRPETKAATLIKLKEIFASLEGVAALLTPADFAALGYPPPDDRMADLVLAARDGYSFGGASEGDPIAAVPPGATPGAHGYLSTDPEMNAIFVAWGAGIRRGVSLGVIRNLDVAPTLARLLGIQLENADGRSIEQVLSK